MEIQDYKKNKLLQQKIFKHYFLIWSCI